MEERHWIVLMAAAACDILSAAAAVAVGSGVALMR